MEFTKQKNSILKKLSITSYVEAIDLNNIIKVKSSLDVRRIVLATWPTFLKHMTIFNKGNTTKSSYYFTKWQLDPC